MRVHLLEWRATLHLYVGQYVQVWGNGVGLPSHPVVGETRIFYFILFIFGTRINPNTESWKSQSSDSKRQQYFRGKVNSMAIFCILTYTHAAPGPQTAGSRRKSFPAWFAGGC